MKPVEYVEYILKHYQDIQREIERLKFELENFKDESPQDTIQSLTYGQTPDNDRVQTSKIGDRTFAVAMIYRHVNQRVNRMGRKELAEVISANEIELERIDRCIDALSEPLHIIIVGLYIEGLSWEEVCAEELISRNALAYRRKKAISKISAMMTLDNKMAI